MEGWDVKEVGYQAGDFHRIELFGKQRLAGTFSWNDMEETHFLACKSSISIDVPNQGEWPLYASIEIDDLEELRKQLSEKQRKAFDAKEDFELRFTALRINCYAKYDVGMIGYAKAEFYEM